MGSTGHQGEKKKEEKSKEEEEKCGFKATLKTQLERMNAGES